MVDRTGCEQLPRALSTPPWSNQHAATRPAAHCPPTDTARYRRCHPLPGLIGLTAPASTPYDLRCPGRVCNAMQGEAHRLGYQRVADTLPAAGSRLARPGRQPRAVR